MKNHTDHHVQIVLKKLSIQRLFVLNCNFCFFEHSISCYNEDIEFMIYPTQKSSKKVQKIINTHLS